MAAMETSATPGRVDGGIWKVTGSAETDGRSEPMRDYAKRISARVVTGDAVAIVLAVIAGTVTKLRLAQTNTEYWGTREIYEPVSVLIAFVWFFALRIARTADSRVLATGSAEFSRTIRASFWVFGLLAITTLVTAASLSRMYLAVVFPVGLILLLLNRLVWRMLIQRNLARGKTQRRVIALGNSSLQELVDTVGANSSIPWEVVGICFTGSSDDVGNLPEIARNVPTTDNWRNLHEFAKNIYADTVAASGVETIGMKGMRELAWDLEGADVDLFVAPGVLDVAGPRISIRPVAGIPLIHLDKPRYRGANQLWKFLFDRVGAALIILMVSPILIVCAIMVKATSSGPVFYVSERMGLNNKPFDMIKFRTMVQGAEKMKAQLADENESEGGVLFKIKDDPRITPVGKVLRRFSLDELPQLFNVLGGSMSLVGPRPPLREEVDRYDALVARRMLVKPGMTGLWQVSGRSNLSWEQSVRLDLSYVENWSLAGDILILGKTLSAVLSRDGAY